jgi:hypothetical protein
MSCKRRFAPWTIAAALALASQTGCMTAGWLLGKKLDSPAISYTSIPVGFFADGLAMRPFESNDASGTELWIGAWCADWAALAFIYFYEAASQ